MRAVARRQPVARHVAARLALAIEVIAGQRVASGTAEALIRVPLS